MEQTTSPWDSPLWYTVMDVCRGCTFEWLLTAVEEGIRQANIPPFSGEARAGLSMPMLVHVACALIFRNNEEPLTGVVRIDAAGIYTLQIPARDN